MGEITLTDFILERVAEDEATARAAISPERPGKHWQWVNCDDDTIAVFDGEYHQVSLRTVEEFPTTSGVGDLPAFVIYEAEVDDDTFSPLPHIARHDPARVLAECEAKRRIVAEHSPVDPCDAHNASSRTVPCDTLRHLAAVYADHPDYREEWRP